MPYLRNAWYAACWAHELGDVPFARTILEQPIVLFRDADGAPRALYDACPHRFAPLSRGRVSGGTITCGYHGLEFAADGQCIRNPHGKGVVPNSLKVTAFPVTERYGMIWLWPGDAERADPALLPSFPTMEDPAFSWVHGQLEVSTNYELVIDNLLDLTHVEFLHPFLASPGNAARTEFRAEERDGEVHAKYDVRGEPITGLFQLLWDGIPDAVGNLIAYMSWQAPSNLFLQTGMSLSDEIGEGDPRIPVVHLLTPETEDRTHYFWAAGRNCRHGDAQISKMLHFGTQQAFEREDEPMIRAVRSRMRSNDLFAHRPALLPIDEVAVRARRILAKRIAAEEAATAAA